MEAVKRDGIPVNLPSNAGDDQCGRPESVWTTSIRPEHMESGHSFHADIFENGLCVCRIVLSGDFESEATAEAALADRLSRWITEYEARRGHEKPMQTDFQ